MNANNAQLNLTRELAEILNYTADTAILIKLHNAYSKDMAS